MPAERQPEERYLSTRDVALTCGVDRYTVREWVSKGILELAGRGYRGAHLFREQDVQSLLRNPPRFWRRDVSTEDIIRLREVEGLTWEKIAVKAGISRSGAQYRYEQYRKPCDGEAAAEPEYIRLSDYPVITRWTASRTGTKQLAATLARELAQTPVGTRLESGRKAGARLGVSGTTVFSARQHLIRLGLIHKCGAHHHVGRKPEQKNGFPLPLGG